MSQKFRAKSRPAWRSIAIYLLPCIAVAMIGLLLYHDIGYKYVLFAAGVGILVLLWRGDLKRLWNLPSLFLLGYAAFSMLAIFWALSGKFHLQRYAVTFTSVFFFLYAVLRGRGNSAFTRRAMSISAGVSTVYAVMGIEAVSTGAFAALLGRLSVLNPDDLSFGGRFNGLFGNANIESSFYAIGIIFSVALICGSDDKRHRAAWSAALACNMFAMVAAVSLGATACLAVALVVYLVFAGKARGEVLSKLLCGALCGGAGAVAAKALFSRAPCMVLVMLLLAALACGRMESKFGDKFVAWADPRQKAIYCTLLCVFALAAVYTTVGLLVAGASYTFKEAGSVGGGVRLEPGVHTLRVDPSDERYIVIYATSRAGVNIGLYSGGETEKTFTIPNGFTGCYVYLYGNEGDVINAAIIDDSVQLKLTHPLLPRAIENRLFGLTAGGSAIQRFMYVQDGFKLFRLSPIIGLGDGAFETAIPFVQEIEYETNHSHNQYVEALLETGVIGFALFAGALLTLGIALWRARKKLYEGEYAWIFPVLCAEFVMSTLQMFWDVSMMVTVFACMIYTLYGVIAATCAEPITPKKGDAELSRSDGKKARNVQQGSDAGVRIACSILPLLFVVSVGCNIHAQSLIRKPTETLGEFMGNLSRAAKLDLYEHNDITLSYVKNAMQNDTDGVYREEADEYARQLSRVKSNTIPYYLVVYYLNTQQYGLAIEEAKAAARYSASDSDMWNNCVDALKQMFIDSKTASPLLHDDGTLMQDLMEYYDMLQRRDAASLKKIMLNANSVEFFEKLQALSDCQGDKEAMRTILTAEPEV